MSESNSVIVRSLLLSAPKEKRLDLAIASLLYTVRKEDVEVILPGQRQMVPVYFFFDGKRGYDAFFFSPKLAIALPGRKGQPAPNPVPTFVRSLEWAWQVEEFVFRSSVACSRGELTVMVSNGILAWEERTQISSRLQKECETSRLLVLATLRVYAPSLLSLLDAEEQKEEEATSTCPAVRVSLIQELVLVPVILPTRFYDDAQCQYEAYDLRLKKWRSCEQEWEEDANACCPSQCPGCGAYYCERHFSHTKYIFFATTEEQRLYGTITVSKAVCLTCALLPEEEVKRLRTARLAINGEPSQPAQKMS